MQDVHLTAKTEFEALACPYTSIDELIDYSPKFLKQCRQGSNICRHPMQDADLVQ